MSGLAGSESTSTFVPTSTDASPTSQKEKVNTNTEEETIITMNNWKSSSNNGKSLAFKLSLCKRNNLLFLTDFCGISCLSCLSAGYQKKKRFFIFQYFYTCQSLIFLCSNKNPKNLSAVFCGILQVTSCVLNASHTPKRMQIQVQGIKINK